MIMLNAELGQTIGRLTKYESRLASVEEKLALTEQFLEGYKCLHSNIEFPDPPSLYTDNFFFTFTLPVQLSKHQVISLLNSVLTHKSYIHLVQQHGCEYFGMVSPSACVSRPVSSIALELRNFPSKLGCDKVTISARHDFRLVEMALAVMAYDTPCAETFCWDPFSSKWLPLEPDYFETRRGLLKRTILLRSHLSEDLEAQFSSAVLANFAPVVDDLNL